MEITFDIFDIMTLNEKESEFGGHSIIDDIVNHELASSVSSKIDLCFISVVAYH